MSIKNQVGDTIVEVMMALAVAGLVIGSSYAVARQSLQMGRQAQERVEALKFIEAQIEQFKTVADKTNLPEPFCIDNSQQPVSSPDTDPQCLKSGRYRLSASLTDPPSNTYTFGARWDRIGGGGQEQLDITYRMHK